MYRVVKMGVKVYAYEMRRLNEEEVENITVFVEEGTPVLLVSSLEEAEEFFNSEVELVKPE